MTGRMLVVDFLALEILLPVLLLRGCIPALGHCIVSTCHRKVPDGDVQMKDGIVDANGEEDSKRVLALIKDVGVDYNQEESDPDKACDIGSHLSYPLPGQSQVNVFSHSQRDSDFELLQSRPACPEQINEEPSRR
jgi:hypothetical protein